MKKIKLYSIIAMLLAITLSLTSCAGIFGGSDISDAFIKNAVPKASLTAKSASQISTLDGMSYYSSNGNLIHMTKEQANGETKHYVYNISTGIIEHTVTSSSSSPVTINLYSAYADGEYVDFFTVNKDETYYLYSANGNQIASSTEYINVSGNMISGEYLINVDGDIYEVSAEGIEKAFTYSKLAEFPDDLIKYGDYYYAYNADESLTIYDSEFNFKSSYKLPSYAEEDNIIILENGNLLIQYSYPADPSSDDYSYIAYGDKYYLVTEIFKVASGKVKEIRCNYIFDGIDNTARFEEYFAYQGIDASVFTVSGSAYSIKDRLLDENNPSYVYIKNNGKVKELDKINGELIDDVELIAKNRWIVEAGSRRYLMDNKGNIIGDVTNASVRGEYLTVDGAIYSSKDLTKLFEYQNDINDYNICASVGSALILVSNEDGEYKLFTGTSDLKTITSVDDDKNLEFYNSYMYGVREDNTVTVYDNAGNYVYSFSAGNYVSTVHYGDDCLIIKATTSAGTTTYHKITLG